MIIKDKAVKEILSIERIIKLWYGSSRVRKKWGLAGKHSELQGRALTKVLEGSKTGVFKIEKGGLEG